MSRPRKPSRAELQLKQETDRLKTTIVVLRHELESKAGFVSRLQCLLSLRTQRIDHLTGKLEQARAQNQRLDAECERLVQMVKLPPSLTVS